MGEGVPFKWESQPGKPINPQVKSFPPLSPPPAVQNLFIPPSPCNNNMKGSTWSSTVRFWKKSKKNQHRKKNHAGKDENDSAFDLPGLGRVDNFEFWSSDTNSVSPLRRSSSTSSTTSSDRFSSLSSVPGSHKKSTASTRECGLTGYSGF
ncbi:hypothetical protein GIB67_035736 [Kingdonia uniflora]|uniref:Uncharacterized protein n=1 Tax=Kingdonia uniflora TaxID=39325 RepID=A0A7J7NVZ0_9MAGN|nr:hypothetical protein GIB67_035736 [Kingdonia uniflora]